MKALKFLYIILFVQIFCFGSLYAQNPPASQTAGGIEKARQEIEIDRKLEKKITTEKKTEADEKKGEEGTAEPEGQKILINTIEIQGATLVNGVIKEIVSRYEGKELGIKDMRKLCDLITDEYRKKGYVTSRAYLPPQKLTDGKLIVAIVEGKVGSIQLRGNKFFKTALLKKKLRLNEGSYFDYDELQRSLRNINEHPDRFARATLAPGKEPGTTDLILDVKDKLPIHVTTGFDNFGSRYIQRQRYTFTLEHNNLTGNEDRFSYRLQRAQASAYQLHFFSYLLPVNESLNIGGYYQWSKMKLGKEYENTDVRGKSKLGGIFLNQELVQRDNFDLNLNLGFDYKRVRNYTLDELSSRDNVRVARIGFDIDNLDGLGRSIFSVEEDFGIPDIMGAVPDKDPMATRQGAGGKFLKTMVNFYRLQPLPLSTSLLWKNQYMHSPYTLPAIEQFQIGGISSVRGYPAAEHSGDKGYTTSFEWSVPLYFIPKDLKTPGNKTTFYDATRVIMFYDWGSVGVNKVLAGESKKRTLKGCGFGLRFNIPDDFYLDVELAYPLSKRSSDEHHLQKYINISKKF